MDRSGNERGLSRGAHGHDRSLRPGKLAPNSEELSGASRQRERRLRTRVFLAGDPRVRSAKSVEVAGGCQKTAARVPVIRQGWFRCRGAGESEVGVRHTTQTLPRLDSRLCTSGGSDLPCTGLGSETQRGNPGARGPPLCLATWVLSRYHSLRSVDAGATK
ncbi:hypothetical protein VUR80DRAFT_3895 [Thermomyces stellatus]